MSSGRRLGILLACFLALAAGIGAALYDVGVQQSATLREKARRLHERRVEVWPRRGAILDRHGRELAVSMESASLYAHPRLVEDPEAAAAILARTLGLPRGALLERLNRDAPFTWIARRLEPAVARAVSTSGLAVGTGRPFGFQTEARRSYPHGSLAVHVVGFTNVDQRGIEGIELAHDELLRGDPAHYLALRDGRGQTVLQLVQPPRRAPRDLVLTIDLVLQHIAESELDRAVRHARARWGSAILLDPATGHVLALANRPTVDPAHYGASPLASRRNRAITDLYEPGSTFKIVSAAAALELGVASPGERFDCGQGSIVVAGTRIRDHKPFSVLTFQEILEQSSNVGMVRIASRIPAPAFERIVRGFGFGAPTEIELPGEVAGRVRPHRQWSGLSRACLAFGHEIAVTPLQMAVAFATIANAGVRVPPRIVLGTRGPEGSFVPAPAAQPQRAISAKTAGTLTRLLEGVVTRGTGKLAAVPGYRVAGKTGTAQKIVDGRYSESDYVTSFGGFAPTRAPRLVCFVLLDTPRGPEHTGGAVAAPVFARIMARALPYLRVAPDDPGPRIAARGPGTRGGASGMGPGALP